MNKENYFSQRNIKNIEKLKEIKEFLPPFCADYFLGVEPNTTPLTRLSYAFDFKIFFEYLVTEINDFKGKNIKDFTLSDLNKLTDFHIENYLSFLSTSNNIKTKSRKFASIRSLLKFFFRKNKLVANVADKVSAPKLRDKEIVRLEVDEVANLLSSVENGSGLTKMQSSFQSHTLKRDMAILTLFLATGIRISELVGLDIADIDFSQNAFKITRKGGSRVILYFSNEVADSLKAYLVERESNPNVDFSDNALFLSLQNKRINVRTVENLVKKYSKLVTPLKKITPHKLRSTYGTNLYKETGDIYVVADVLGHKDVNTTKKYYAAITDDIRRNAANKVKLR
jgi:site-specific recombinase XerD